MTKTKIIFYTVAAIAVIVFSFLGFAYQQDKEPWTAKQLMEPADLAKILNDVKSPQPTIYCIGPQAVIKNSIFVGPTQTKENMKTLRDKAGALSKDAHIVIYCGCCPFSRCPNIRPAFRALTEMGFKNLSLLNLSRNIKVDWIDHNYPVNN
jgi:thiosulfate/3-mercaptopyruvate sulfurtransferase